MRQLVSSIAIGVSSLAVGGLLLSAGSAQAQFRDAAGNVHFQAAGQTPSLSLQASTGEYSRTVTANFCGFLVASKPNATTPVPATINVNLVAIDSTAFPILSLPSCLNNAPSEPRAADFKTADGRVVLVGRTPGVQYTVGYPGVPAPKSIPVNACGYGKITNSVTNPAPATFVFAGTTYTTAALPLQVPNLCVNGVRYAPAP